MMPVSAFAGLLLMAGVPAEPQAQAGPAQTVKAEDEMVCKYQARTATRFKKKICHTRARWEEISETAKRQAAQDFNKPTISIERGN